MKIRVGATYQAVLFTGMYNGAHDKRFLGAGALIRMSGGRLPKRIVFGNINMVQCGENGVGRRMNGPVAHRATSGRLA